MYDMIIIGAGIAGMTAAIYGARANKKVLLLDKFCYGGQIINSNNVENFPGFFNISGFDLMTKVYDQVKNLNVDIKFEEVVSLNDANTVITNKDEYKTKTIIIANGLIKRTLGLYGEKDLLGHGISYCATCDGNFYKNKNVAIVGGGNTALEDSIYLSNIVNKLYIIHRRDNFKADSILIDKISNCSNVEILFNSCVTKLIGEDKLNKIEINNNRTIDIDGLFIAIGEIPNNSKFSNLIKLDDAGFIISNDTRTNVNNIFVAGDTRTKDVRQLITAASDGTIAASYAIKLIDN